MLKITLLHRDKSIETYKSVINNELDTTFHFVDLISAIKPIDLSNSDLLLIYCRSNEPDDLEILNYVTDQDLGIHIILLGDVIDAYIALRCLRSNICDYVVIPQELCYLKTRIENLFQLTSSSKSPVKTLENKKERRKNRIHRLHPDKTLETAIKHLRNNYQEEITTEELAKMCYISPSHLSRIFKKETGKTISQYLADYRINLAKKLLVELELSIEKIAFSVGYQDTSYFGKKFKTIVGMTPRQYQQQARNTILSEHLINSKNNASQKLVKEKTSLMKSNDLR